MAVTIRFTAVAYSVALLAACSDATSPSDEQRSSTLAIVADEVPLPEMPMEPAPAVPASTRSGTGIVSVCRAPIPARIEDFAAKLATGHRLFRVNTPMRSRAERLHTTETASGITIVPALELELSEIGARQLHREGASTDIVILFPLADEKVFIDQAGQRYEAAPTEGLMLRDRYSAPEYWVLAYPVDGEWIVQATLDVGPSGGILTPGGAELSVDDLSRYAAHSPELSP
ncbi:MAG: hypothetical protein IPK60_18625 [Sandaracinaceae bacterium]|jgi:hypothetical protein|nr:hypothetical protein [Sandaracinaceae bacterium]